MSATPTAPLVGSMGAYLGIVAAIGWWASRRTLAAPDFFVAGRTLGLFTMTMAAMAANISGFVFVGGPGLLYAAGIGALFISLPLGVTTAQGAWLLAKRMRLLSDVRGTFTVPGAIGARFRSPAAQGLAGLSILIAVVGYIATNFLALGYVVDAVFHIGLEPAIWVGGALVIAYSVGGGILAGVYTDLFQGAVMAFSSVAVFFFALKSGGGLGEISRAIMDGDAGYVSPWGKMTALQALSLYFVFGFGSLGQPHVVHKFFMLRDATKLKWYPLLMAFAMSLALLAFVAIGLVMRAHVARGAIPPLAHADEATMTFLTHFAPAGLAGLVLAGIAAAIMSTVNAFLNVGAAALTHDLPNSLGKPPSTRLMAARLATAVIGVAALALAATSQTTVAFLGIFGWGLFAATLVPALAIGLNWKGASREGAVASIGTGLLITLGGESLVYANIITMPAGVSATALALSASALVFFAVSYVTRRSAPHQLDADIEALMDM